MAKQFISLENLEHFWDKAKQIIIDNEQTTSAALNDLNVRVDSLEENESLNGHIDNDDIHVTAEDKAKWDAATENNGDGHTHSNKEVLDGITANKVSSWDNKQDTITDLATIRSNAEKGASALQSIPAEYVTETELGTAVNTAITELVGNAPETLNTIEEIADALRDNKDIVSVLETSIANKADKASIPTKVSDLTNDSKFISSIPAEYVTESELNAKGYLTSHQDISGKANASDLTAHTNNSNIHVTTTDKSKWNAAEQNAKAYADGLNASMDARVGDIEETLPETERRLANVENGFSAPDARNHVLWIGTSIPAGDIQHGNNGTTQSTTTNLGSNNYPKMVADALGFKLYNNSRGSSFVCFYPPNEDGTANWAGKDWSEYSSEVWKGYSLSASFAQVDEKFGPNGLNCPQWLINNFKSYSYESLIIPYIDGTLASCDTVIIDHGYNDRSIIINEASWHPGEGETQFARGAGRDWLLKLQDPFETTLEAETYFQGKWWNDESVSSKKHYMSAIIFLAKKIWAVNPKIKIIIGNYFASKSNTFGAEFGNDRLAEFVNLANSACASWLRVNCVDIWKHTGIYNRNLPAGNDFQLFCPDGVHPHSDSTGHSNKIIAGVYINAIRGTLYI